MTTALAERDDVTVEGEVIEHRPPLTLFGTDDPSAVVERATRVATVLADVIKQRNLAKRIGNRDHIQIEGWTLLGSMLGVFGEVEWTRPIERGWEARAVARTMAGATVGAAEAMCTRGERTWSNRDEYAIRSMAQTRALSKALRLPLGFIVELAGFAATPAEEMDAIDQPEQRRGSATQGRESSVRAESSPNAAAPAPRNRGDALGRLAEVAREHDMSFAKVDEKARELGVDRRTGGVEDILRLIAAIEQPGSPHVAPADSPEAGSSGPASGSTPDHDGSGMAVDPATATSAESEAVPPGTDSAAPPAPSLDDVLAATGGEVIPPKKGTPEYDALPSGVERSAARAYWAKHKDPEPEQESLAEALGAPAS
jgi:hypothetical protein